MSLSNCSRCGRMFHKSSAGRVCSDCIAEEERQFVTVRDFLEETPGCSLDEIEAATGVESAVVMRFLREGRLATLGELASGVRGECKRCGTEIAFGKFCKDCITAMGTSLRDSVQELNRQQPTEAERRNSLTRRPETLRDRRLD